MRKLGWLVVSAVLLVLGMGPAVAHAGALSTSITSTQSSPVAGEAVTFTAHATGGSGPNASYVYTWTVDGSPGPARSTSNSLTRAFSAGQHKVRVKVDEASCECQNSGQTEVSFTVYPQLAGSISASPDPAKAGSPVTLTAKPSGGKPAYAIAWDTDGNGFNDGTGPSIKPTFHTQGQRTVRALVRDSASPSHFAVLTKNLAVGLPDSCHQQLDFGLSEVTTSGCLTRVRTNPDFYETTSAVQLNGISFPAPAKGHKTVVTLPHRGAPGGSIILSGTSISFRGLTVFRGNVAWKLPAGRKGQEKALATLTVPAAQKLLGLKVGGTVAVRLGWRSNGTHYAAFPLSIELPEVFKAGPDRGSGGISGTGSVRVDRGGVHLDGLKIQVANAYVGKIKVQSACFSYAAKGSQSVEPCSGPSVGGSPYITCSNSANTERFDGSAVLELPTGSHPRLGAFGGIADSRLSKLGGFADHLGTSVPLASGVYLNRVGVGLCVYPPPFKLRGDVGVNVLPVGGKATVGIDGYFLYTDGFNAFPWSLELGGSVTVFDTTIGTGKVILRPTGSIDFSANANFNLLGVASVSGGITGWIEVPKRTFDIEGNVQGCLRTLCAGTDAVVSSRGVAGCVKAGSISIPTIVKDSDWTFYTPWRVHTDYNTVNLQAGFGYRWHDTSISLLGTACDMSSFHEVRSTKASAAAAVAGRDFLVPAHTQSLSLRVKGISEPPKLVVTAPGGQQFRSSDSAPAATRPGHWEIVENPTDGTTSVLIVRPAPGRWNVNSLDPAKPITRLETAGFRVPPSFAASVRRGRHGSRVLSLSYGVSSDEQIAVIERGRQVLHTLTRKLAARRCPRGPSRVAGRRLLCARIAFQPSFGPGGRRKVQAVITRNGQPVKTVTLATFHVASPARPRRQRSLRMVRRSGGVIFAWTGAAYARTHSISVTLSSGREYGVSTPARCRAVVLRNISRNVGVRVRIVGLRRDLIAGPSSRLLLKAGRSRSGSRAKLPGRVCSA